MNEHQIDRLQNVIEVIEAEYPDSYAITAANALVRSLGGKRHLDGMSPEVIAVYMVALSLWIGVAHIEPSG